MSLVLRLRNGAWEVHNPSRNCFGNLHKWFYQLQKIYFQQVIYTYNFQRWRSDTAMTSPRAHILMSLSNNVQTAHTLLSTQAVINAACIFSLLLLREAIQLRGQIDNGPQNYNRLTAHLEQCRLHPAPWITVTPASARSNTGETKALLSNLVILWWIQIPLLQLIAKKEEPMKQL